MTTVNSTTYAAQEGAKMALSSGIINTSVKVTSGDYEAEAAASGTVINLCKLPKGVVVHDVVIDTEALGTSVTLAVGDGADNDRYIAATAAATAGQIKMGIGGKGYRVGTNEGDDVLTATVGGAAATGKIHFTVLYA